jgi:hypothetical protein
LRSSDRESSALDLGFQPLNTVILKGQPRPDRKGTKIRHIPGANVDVDLDFDVVLDLDLNTAWTGMIR